MSAAPPPPASEEPAVVDLTEAMSSMSLTTVMAAGISEAACPVTIHVRNIVASVALPAVCTQEQLKQLALRLGLVSPLDSGFPAVRLPTAAGGGTVLFFMSGTMLLTGATNFTMLRYMAWYGATTYCTTLGLPLPEVEGAPRGDEEAEYATFAAAADACRGAMVARWRPSATKVIANQMRAATGALRATKRMQLAAEREARRERRRCGGV